MLSYLPQSKLSKAGFAFSDGLNPAVQACSEVTEIFQVDQLFVIVVEHSALSNEMD